MPTMRTGWTWAWTLLLAAASSTFAAPPELAAQAGAAAATPPHVTLLRVDGAISPASADYLVHGIDTANAQRAAAVVLELDTPGGLSDAMRDIIRAILSSDVPVIGYVAPQGARAASAGTYILSACQVAAMAPATNVGAATPVSLLGGSSDSPAPTPQADKSKAPPAPASENTEMRKATNDAVAYLRSLAEQRGRNADWAEKAVRDAASVSADQALKLHVIDLIAPDVPTLLAQVDGMKVTTAAGSVVLRTKGATVNALQPGWRSQFLAVIANPSVALILLLIGLGGLVMEGAHPGGIFPGVLGAICLLLALYAFQLLPVNFAGLGLMLLGVVLIVSEAFIPAYGVLGIGGVIAFVIGAVVLMRSGTPAYGIALPTVIGLAIAGAGVIAGILWLALRSHARPVVSGREEMLGALGVAVDDFQGRGMVHVHGERWQADSRAALQQGQEVKVTGIRGLVLDVEPADPATHKEA
jgi:membrane-bound serine protease (ClpP class)